MNIKETIRSAIRHYQSGNLQFAEDQMHQIIKRLPDDPEVLYFLGILSAQMEKFDSAIHYIEKSLRFQPDNPDAYVALGMIFHQRGQPDEALEFYRRAIEFKPHNALVYCSLGDILREKGRPDEAIPCYREALRINPDNATAYYHLGCSFQQKGSIEQAIESYQKVLQIEPSSVEAYNSLGNILRETGNFHEAIACYQHALRINPTLAEVQYNLGNAFRLQGEQRKALDAYDRAIGINPDYIAAHLAKCMSQLPIIYDETADLEISRKRYAEELAKLTTLFANSHNRHADSFVDAVGCHQPFYLTCQEMDNRELQQTYGNLVCSIMAAKYPSMACVPQKASLQIGEKIRIGIVSSHCCWHSVWKIPLRGWIECLDRDRFSVYGYYTGTVKDHITEKIRAACERFVEDVFSFEELCSLIRKDDLHVLIYPEIGMDAFTLKLASLRLAPIQCTSLGHPDTSGLPTIDYFLSSELMEPPDADRFYTENLIRLPNLGFSYMPFAVPASTITREDLGLRPGTVIYLCCHALFTHLPQYDTIYPCIARQVPDSHFLFITHTSREITDKFLSRLQRAFRQQNMDADEHVRILPRLDQMQYHAMNSVADVFLDTMAWSANNSTFEALACNLPVVTLPGRLMRQRHCSGILTMLGLSETIASSLEEYLDIAVRLGRDSSWRREISDKIAANKSRLYHDRECITALEDFLAKVVNG